MADIKAFVSDINNQFVFARILTLMGVAAWMPYMYIHYYWGIEVEMRPFLVVHLIGVIGGGTTTRLLAKRKATQ